MSYRIVRECVITIVESHQERRKKRTEGGQFRLKT